MQHGFSTIHKVCKESLKKEDLPATLGDLGIHLSPDELQAALASASIDGETIIVLIYIAISSFNSEGAV